MKVTYSVELLEATINKQVARIEVLEFALREIKDCYCSPEQSYAIAKAALAPRPNGPDE